MVKGPNQLKLEAYIDEIAPGVVDTAASDWQSTKVVLDTISTLLESRVGSIQERFRGQTAEKTGHAFKQSASSMTEKAGELHHGSQALTQAAEALREARKVRHSLGAGEDPPADPGITPGSNDPEDVQKQKDYDTKMAAIHADYLQRESQAAAAIAAMEAKLHQSNQTMKQIHGYPDPVEPDSPAAPGGGGRTPVMPTTHTPQGGGSGGNGSGGNGNGGNGNGGNGNGGNGNGGNGNGGNGNGGNGNGTDSGGGDGGGSGSLGEPIGGSTIGGSADGTSGGLSIGPLGGAAAAGAGALTLGALGRAMRGGGLSGVPAGGAGGAAGAAGRSSGIAARAIGASSRTGGSTTLGRGGAGGAGAGTAGRGAGAGGRGAGASGRAGAGTAGRGAGASGRGAGAAGRGGAAGGRGGAAGAGGRGRKRDEDEQRKGEEYEQLESEWIDDEDAAPGILG